MGFLVWFEVLGFCRICHIFYLSNQFFLKWVWFVGFWFFGLGPANQGPLGACFLWVLDGPGLAFR